MRDERLEVSVTFVPAKGYVASAPELRQPVVALSLAACAERRSPPHSAARVRACQ
jgi:hypothetical protein